MLSYGDVVADDDGGAAVDLDGGAAADRDPVAEGQVGAGVDFDEEVVGQVAVVAEGERRAVLGAQSLGGGRGGRGQCWSSRSGPSLAVDDGQGPGSTYRL